MLYLLIVSFIWAFSFGLIKGQLTGLDSNFVSFARLFISALVFLPFLRLRGVKVRLAGQLALTGTLQYGLMYLAYIYAYQFLQAYEVALFTIFTPIYVTLVNDFFRRHLNGFHLFMALVTVAGTGIIVYQNLNRPDFWFGFFILQISNLCFAFGQIYYKEVMRKHTQLKDYQIFGLLYLGAVVLTAFPAALTTDWPNLTLTAAHIRTLLYLGVVASGIGFFLWNYGARRVNGGTLAVFNNLKVPLAVAVSILIFGEQANVPRLLGGGGLILAALFANEAWHRRTVAVTEPAGGPAAHPANSSDS